MAINDYYSDITLKTTTESLDETGGATIAYSETTFKGLITIASSRELELAKKMQIESTHTLYCDVSVDINYADMVSFNGQNYQVVDEPRNTVQRNHHYKIMLKKVINDG